MYLHGHVIVNRNTCNICIVTRKLLPHLKAACIAGTRGPSFGIAGFWAVEKEAKAHAELPVTFKLIDGANHFVSNLLLVYV